MILREHLLRGLLYFTAPCIFASLLGAAMPPAAAVPSIATAPSPSPTPSIKAIPPDPNSQYVQQACPAIDTLTRSDAFIWTAPPDWKSYDESFSEQIDHFSGAQWAGVNIGKIFCIYIGKGQATFPIILERDALVPSPSGNTWGPDQGGYKNCNSFKVNDCPFLIEVPKQPGDVYKEIDFFKTNKPNNGS